MSRGAKRISHAARFCLLLLRESGKDDTVKITEDIRYIGVNDHDIDLFEGQYVVKNGMAYNSYVVLDEKIAVFDTVDARFGNAWQPDVA